MNQDFIPARHVMAPPTSMETRPPPPPPPPPGYPTESDRAFQPNKYPVETTTRGDGFWKGCCAALCCCCVLDACF